MMNALLSYAPYAVIVLTALIGLACWTCFRPRPMSPTSAQPQPAETGLTLVGDDGSIDDGFYIELVD